MAGILAADGLSASRGVCCGGLFAGQEPSVDGEAHARDPPDDERRDHLTGRGAQEAADHAANQ